MIPIKYILRTWRPLPIHNTQWRSYNGTGDKKPKSPHGQWYADVMPAMIPIFLLGSAVYLGLQLTQVKLSHEEFVEQAAERVKALEAEVDALQEKRANTRSQGSTTVSKPDDTNVGASHRWWWWR